MKPAYFSACKFREIRRKLASNYRDLKRAHLSVLMAGNYTAAAVLRAGLGRVVRDWTIARSSTPRVGPPLDPCDTVRFFPGSSLDILFGQRDPQRAPAVNPQPVAVS